MTGDSNSRSGDEVIQKRSLASLLKTRPSREATSPCSFEMLRSLFLTVAILWFGMPHSVARGFEVEGRLEYRVQPVGQSVDSAIRHDYDFFVRVTDEGWFIRTRPLPETQRYYECGYDGKFLYEYVFSNSSSNSPTGYNGSGTIEKKDVPTYGGSMACFVWLAYASAEHLAGAAHSMMRPLWRLDDAFLSREGHRVRATWLTNSDVLGLPKELSMFDDGVIRWSDPDGRRHSEGRAAPFDKGFSCLKYRAVMITNVNGLLLPEISECSYFVPLPAAKEVSDLAVSSQVKIYSDRFFPKPRNDRVVPILRGTTQVDDLRFWTTTGGVPVVRYVLANTTNWPTMEDEFVKALVAKSMSRSSGYPAKAPQKNAKWVMYGFLIMTTVALFFTIRKLGSRVDRKAG